MLGGLSKPFDSDGKHRDELVGFCCDGAKACLPPFIRSTKTGPEVRLARFTQRDRVFRSHIPPATWSLAFLEIGTDRRHGSEELFCEIGELRTGPGHLRKQREHPNSQVERSFPEVTLI